VAKNKNTLDERWMSNLMSLRHRWYSKKGNSVKCMAWMIKEKLATLNYIQCSKKY